MCILNSQKFKKKIIKYTVFNTFFIKNHLNDYHTYPLMIISHKDLELYIHSFIQKKLFFLTFFFWYSNSSFVNIET